jgi:hypothetical protein
MRGGKKKIINRNSNILRIYRLKLQEIILGKRFLSLSSIATAPKLTLVNG